MGFELLTTTQMAEADRSTIASGVAGIALMERAGAAVAAAAARLAAPKAARRVAVACGPGNNGGDGFVAARLLRDRGFDVALGLLGERDALKGDAAAAAGRYAGAVGPLADLDFAAAEVVVDAIFGAGLARDLDGAARAAVEAMNAAARPVVAVDVPSGVDGNTGAVRGIAVAATRTVTFFRAKPGHLLFPARGLCGALEVVDIGILETVLPALDPKTFVNAPGLWRAHFPVLRPDGHKYSRGHAVAVCGSLTHTGAARLAARGALRAGAGLVTLASPGEALLANAAHLTAIMLTRCDGPVELAALLADSRKNAVVLGPALGVGAATRALVEAALLTEAPYAKRPDRAVVLDADALTSFTGDAAGLASLVARAAGPVVLTPHDGEFDRLFDREAGIRAGSKLDRARAAAAFVGGVVVLKGADTVVAHPDGRAAIGTDLPPWLATAGSGDVLGGIIAGMLAQKMPAFEAACCGVWLHGAAGRGFGPGLIAEDLPEALPPAIRRLTDDEDRSDVD